MLPILYHTHHSAHSEDIPFWLDLAQQQNGAVLELGCGTGRVTIPLALAGWQVTGLDHDPAMLACLHDNLPAAHISEGKIHLVQADMTAFDFGVHFPLIILPCNTLSTLRSPARKSVLQRVVAHLERNGVFAVSLPNPGIFFDLPQRSKEQVEETFFHPKTGNPVQVLSSWRRTKTQFIVTWHYDHLLPNGKVERASAEARHELDQAEVYVREIAASGLQIQAIYGDFNKTAFDPEGDEMIIVANKTAS